MADSAQVKPGMLIIGSGPSGAGKNSVFGRVLELQAGKMEESVSCTTRAPRPGEVDGRDYYFVSDGQFEAWERDNYFLESAGSHNGKRYGTPLEPVLEKLRQGIDVLLVIEVKGAKLARQRMPEALTIFIMPAGKSLDEKLVQLEDQLGIRGSESSEAVQERLRIAKEEIAQADEYQHVVVNAPGELEAAVVEVNGIIEEARRQRAARA